MVVTFTFQLPFPATQFRVGQVTEVDFSIMIALKGRTLCTDISKSQTTFFDHVIRRGALENIVMTKNQH